MAAPDGGCADAANVKLPARIPPRIKLANRIRVTPHCRCGKERQPRRLCSRRRRPAGARYFCAKREYLRTRRRREPAAQLSPLRAPDLSRGGWRNAAVLITFQSVILAGAPYMRPARDLRSPLFRAVPLVLPEVPT